MVIFRHLNNPFPRLQTKQIVHFDHKKRRCFKWELQSFSVKKLKSANGEMMMMRDVIVLEATGLYTSRRPDHRSDTLTHFLSGCSSVCLEYLVWDQGVEG